MLFELPGTKTARAHELCGVLPPITPKIITIPTFLLQELQKVQGAFSGSERNATICITSHGWHDPGDPKYKPWGHQPWSRLNYVIVNSTIDYIATSTCSQAIRSWIGGVTREKKYAKHEEDHHKEGKHHDQRCLTVWSGGLGWSRCRVGQEGTSAARPERSTARPPLELKRRNHRRIRRGLPKLTGAFKFFLSRLEKDLGDDNWQFGSHDPKSNYWFDFLLWGSMWALLLLGPLWDRKPIRGKPVDIKIQFY